jgi:methionyl aminopeptidase
MDDAPGERSLYRDIFRCTGEPSGKFGIPFEEPDIAAIDHAARLIDQALEVAEKTIHPGIRPVQLAEKIESFLQGKGADRGIIIHISPEDTVWHGIPDGRILKDGAIVSVDVSCSVNGWWADSARTFAVGTVNDERSALCESALLGTKIAVSSMFAGSDGSSTSRLIGEMCRKHSVRLVGAGAGHRIGRRLHEIPSITYDGRNHETLKPGLVYTAEPVFTSGNADIYINSSGQAVTSDGKPSAHFEVTVLVLEQAVRVLGSPDWFNGRGLR